MSSETNRMDGHERFRQLIKSENAKIIAKLFEELGMVDSKKLIQECYRDEPDSALTQYVKRAAKASLTKHEEILECCKLLLSHGANVNELNLSKKTALHVACHLGDDKMVKLLLEHGADPSVVDGSGFNSLFIAIHTGAIDCVRLIVAKNKELIHSQDAHGGAPVLAAVQKGDLDQFKVLVTAGADVNVQEVTSRRTPLHYALYLENKEIFQYLLNSGADLTKTDHRETNIVHRCCAVSEPWYLEQILSSDSPDTKRALKMEDGEGATPVIVACQNGNIEQLRRLVESGAPVASRDKVRRCALHHCAENTDPRCAEYILRSIPSLMTATDDEGLTPLHMAVIASNIPLIKLLLKRGANLKAVDNEKHTAVHWATVCGHADVLSVLLENSAEVNIPDKHHAYPIHYAAQMVTSNVTSQTILKNLVQNKSPVEAEDKDKRTPMIWAASAGSSEACTILCECGADANKTDKDGLTALHCAASRGHSGCVETLINSCRAQLDPVDKNQCTPLFYAATLGHLDCLKMLLDLGADSRHRDTKGRTVAHCAVVSGSTDVIKVLIDHNVDLWTRNIKGDQPIHEAAQSGNIDVIQYLFDHSDGQADVVNNSNTDGRTCLHIAALTNNLWLCKMLLDDHAHVNALMTSKGKYYTPYDVALIKGHNELREVLTSYGARPGSAIVDHAAETIQIKYRYLKKREVALHKANSANNTSTKFENQREPDLIPAHVPKYVDKSTQFRTKPIGKTPRKTVNESVFTLNSNSNKLDESRAEKLHTFQDFKESTSGITSSLAKLSSDVTLKSQRRVLSKQDNITLNSPSEDCETQSEISTYHGNTTDIESSGGDQVQRRAKAKRALKLRRIRVLNKTPTLHEQDSGKVGVESDTSQSLSSHAPSLSGDSLGAYDYSSSRSASSKELKSRQVDPEHRSNNKAMGCGTSNLTSLIDSDSRYVLTNQNNSETSLKQDSSRAQQSVPGGRRRQKLSNRNRQANVRGRMSPHNKRKLKPLDKSSSKHTTVRSNERMPKMPETVVEEQTPHTERKRDTDHHNNNDDVRSEQKEDIILSQIHHSDKPAPSKPNADDVIHTTLKEDMSESRTHDEAIPSKSSKTDDIIQPQHRDANDTASSISTSSSDDAESNTAKAHKTKEIRKHNKDSQSRSTESPADNSKSSNESKRLEKIPERNLYSRSSHPAIHSAQQGTRNEVKRPKSTTSLGKNLKDTSLENSNGFSPRKKMTKADNLVQSVQESVMRYEIERQSIRQLHQIKKILIYSGSVKDKTVFKRVIGQYGQGHSKKTADTWNKYFQEQMRLIQERRANRTHYHETQNASLDDDHPKTNWNKNHNNVTRRRPDVSVPASDRYSKSLDETTSRHTAVGDTDIKRPQTHQESRRHIHQSDENGYYNDPRLSTSTIAVKRRQELTQLQLIQAYRPFGGIEIFAKPKSSQPNVSRKNRPISSISTGSRNRMNRSLASFSSRKNKPGETNPKSQGSVDEKL